MVVLTSEEQIQQLQTQVQQLIGQMQHMQPIHNSQNPFPQNNPTTNRPNLDLPKPPPFSGNPLELNTFKINLTHFLRGNFNTYFDNRSQVMCAGALLSGPAAQWYETLLDPQTTELPHHYNLDNFLAELTDFFGGRLTKDSREHSLDDLRQTGSVSALAIAFQNIINTYVPQWNDSASIYFFSRKLKESIRFEITARGNVPVLHQAYIAAAISVEHNQAAAIKGRPQHQQQQPQQQQQQRPPPPNRPQAILPVAGAGPMEVDGSRRPDPLNPEDRRRRADNNLYAYCGQSNHLIGTCALAARVRQARGTFPGFTPTAPPPPPGYFIPPPGFQFPSFQGPYPGPWAVIPSPHTQFGTPPPAVPKNNPPSQ